MENVAAIILAAGRGTRMNSTTVNKVMSEVHNAPLLQYSIKNLSRAGVIKPIIIVVGFAKESIQNKFSENLGIKYVIQEKQIGTADALRCGLRQVAPEADDVLSVYGDDSYTYDPLKLKELIKHHQQTDADITLLTVEKENPFGLGRIIREGEKVVGIVEEKVATEEQKKITEVNTGCFIFKKQFIIDHIREIQPNSVTQELYITDIIEIGRKHNAKIEVVKGGNMLWHGINTPEDLELARKMPTRII